MAAKKTVQVREITVVHMLFMRATSNFVRYDAPSSQFDAPVIQNTYIRNKRNRRSRRNKKKGGAQVALLTTWSPRRTKETRIVGLIPYVSPSNQKSMMTASVD